MNNQLKANLISAIHSEILVINEKESMNVYSIRSYSGRGMYGKECLGIEISKGADLSRLAVSVGKDWLELGEPKRDQLGMGTILYWPHTCELERGELESIINPILPEQTHPTFEQYNF